ncbi:MAG: phage major capsid protein [Rhizobiales bacterium]|nr:phage major capsid protein [Hyphomicrobiales bacterium]
MPFLVKSLSILTVSARRDGALFPNAGDVRLDGVASMRLHELQEKRAGIVADMRGINEKAEAEKRDYSADEDTTHKSLKTELAGLDKQIERARDLQEAERSAPAILHSGRHGDGSYEQRAGQFSLVKAINARLGDPVDAAFEREISQEVARRSGRKFSGIAVPDEYFRIEKRTLLTSGDAASLYPETHRGDLFIDLLRSAIVTGRLGATILDGLVGDQDIPRQTKSSVAAWLSEDAALTETDPDFDDVVLSPKTVGSMTSYSRRTLINSVPSIENIVRRDLAAVIANAIDLQAMLGNGSGNTPTGIVNAGATEIDLSVRINWETILAFIASVEHADAAIGSLGWAMNAWSVRKLRSVLKDGPNGDSPPVYPAHHDFLMEAPNMLAGYPAVTTSALPGNPNDSPATLATIIFGAWSQLLVGYWSSTDILVNPFETAAYARGRVLIRAMRDVDVAVRHPASFAFTNNMAVTPFVYP